ncbi:MAG: adenylyltransferase/cytidyltransferase family protein, partial [Eubacterium sp.]|nr:adenylyltransferase/cytidyltransferase family protein [Eubacterium sp.]
MKIAICPGSFDPMTLGHLDIVERACEIFDKVIVLVMSNSSKNSVFTVDERIELIKKCVKSDKVEVDTYNGLLVDYAKNNNATVI